MSATKISTIILHIKKNFLQFLFLYIKMTKKDCQKDKEKLRKEARERYQILSEAEKVKKRQYHREYNKNLSGQKSKSKLNI